MVCYMAYPYQNGFTQSLIRRNLAPITIENYHQVLEDFYNYEMNFNLNYQRTLDLQDIVENDVKAYLEMIVKERQYSNETYNKYLSFLNNYFRFLFVEKIIDTLPTIRLKGLKREDNLDFTDTRWLYDLPIILQNKEIHYYTKLSLIFLARGFTVQEMLTDGFYQILNNLELTTYETEFFIKFEKFITPIQRIQKSPDLFLKIRISPNDPLMTDKHLYKYLKRDSLKLGFDIHPRNLHQSFLIHFLHENESNTEAKLTDDELLDLLRLDPSSLAYYKKIAFS